MKTFFTAEIMKIGRGFAGGIGSWFDITPTHTVRTRDDCDARTTAEAVFSGKIGKRD